MTVSSNSGAYQNEIVWNEGLGNGAGGGGVSTVWPQPAWQKNVPGMYSTTNRNVPDVALNADSNTGYSIYHAGRWAIYGGTSCAAPLWAAFVALVNQELTAQGKASVGFINPKIYTIGTSTAYAQNFHDRACLKT